MNKGTELKLAADKYRATLAAHKLNPKNYDALDAWDRATSEFMEIINNDELNIIADLLDKMDLETGYREGAFLACNRWHDKFRESESKLEIAENRIAELESRPLSAAVADVLAERQRQKESKGYTERRDDNYLPGVLNLAGAAYAVSVSALPDAMRRAQRLWPWPDAGKYLKSSPKEPRAALVKAGALILAEIERIDRAAGGTVEEEQ
ncbi:hypothetical protein [Enterobacter sp. R1(2018)]|uniref:hypothetical protein n=1 Tax=Enterobacter sp. R1(2018) TaxID=2447891 RepID=UPI0011C39FCF|nr:hypothetical protein [Enterobacter sp. R1(2018)]